MQTKGKEEEVAERTKIKDMLKQKLLNGGKTLEHSTKLSAALDAALWKDCGGVLDVYKDPITFDARIQKVMKAMGEAQEAAKAAKAAKESTSSSQ